MEWERWVGGSVGKEWVEGGNERERHAGHVIGVEAVELTEAEDGCQTSTIYHS